MPARFMHVDHNLFRGGEPSAEDLAMLRDIWNVGKIVSLDGKIGEAIHPHCMQLGLRHAIIPIGDGNSPNVKVLRDNLWDIFDMSHDDPEDERVYVHCLHGKDRTGMAVAMYRIMRGCPADMALQEAYFHGMGRGLAPLTRHSYFQAVRDFAEKNRKEIEEATHRGGYRDINAVIDAPTMVREQMGTSPVSHVSAPAPSGHPMRQSIPPTFERGEYGIGHTTEPLSASAAARQTLYRKDSPVGIIAAGNYWFTSRGAAEEYAAREGKSSANMWQADISPHAKVVKFKRRLDISAAEQMGAQLVGIENGGYYNVLDTNGLEAPVSAEEYADVNDAMPQIGAIYQYPGGTVPWGPSSGGGTLPAMEGGDTPTGGGAGSSGFAGVVLPFGAGFQSS